MTAATSAPRPAAGGTRRGRCRPRPGYVASLVAGTCYLAWAVAVHLRLLDGLDKGVRGAARPDGAWGPQQVDAARVVDWLAPAHLAWPLSLGFVAVAALRRSLRPVATVAAAVVPLIVVMLATKYVMAHWEQGPAPVSHGGFPSGHLVGVVAVFSAPALLSRPRNRWLWTLPALLGLVMGTALILADVHPATDVIGAGLLAVAVLACPLTRVRTEPDAVAGRGRHE